VDTIPVNPQQGNSNSNQIYWAANASSRIKFNKLMFRIAVTLLPMTSIILFSRQGSMNNKTKPLIIVALVVALIAGCAKELPKCSDEDTLLLTRQIIVEALGNPQGLSDKELQDNLEVELPRASDFDEKINKYRCEANLIAGGTVELPIAYESQLGDNDEHIVSVQGIARDSIIALTSALTAVQAANPRVLIETSKGNITVVVFPGQAPQSAGNFLNYVKNGFYDGLVFHRVIPGFMIEGGGMTPDMGEKPKNAPIQNEADNGLKNYRGTLAMVRTGEPHSASSQFFINLKDNAFLDHRGKSLEGWGYTVFGQVIDGMNVVDAIAAVPRGNRGPHSDVPTDPILMKRVTVLPAANQP
jgi:peptidylprolyl isomerase/peptidyl-prolyl cis-trans isomerase B (cyclophilin B)